MAKNLNAERYQENLQGEIDSASLYRALAEAEADPQRSKIFLKLATVEDAHAEFWRQNLKRINMVILRELST